MKLLLFFIGFCAVQNLLAQIPTDNLEAYYKFNGNLVDDSGNGNNITDFSGSYSSDRFSQSNSAFSLNGETDSLVLPVTAFAPISGDFSISFWYKTNWPQVMNLFSSKQSPTDTTQNFEIQLNSHNSTFLNDPSLVGVWYQTFAYWNGSGYITDAVAEGAPGQYTKGEWCHFVITREADTIQIYRNHSLYSFSIDQLYGGTLGDAVNLIFSAAPYRFKGAIDDMRLYTKALDQSEVDLLWFENRPFLFNDPKPTDAYVPGSNLFANWQYDETQVSDTIIVEYSINGGPWIAAAHSGMSYEYFTYLDLNYAAGTKIEFRVEDKADPTKFAQSGQFTISEYDWMEVSPSLPWNSKDGAGLLNFNGRMWSLGGWDPPFNPPNSTNNDIWSSVDGVNWTFEGTAPWPARHCSAWLVYDNAMWVIGGDPQSGCLRDVWKSTDGINWISLEDTIPGYSPRHNTNYAPLNDKMLMLGGSSCSVDPPTAYNQVWESTDGLSWNQLANAPWTGRSMQINYCVDDSNSAWILGGAGEHDRRSYNDIWKTNDGTNWTLVNASAPWGGRNWHTTAWFDNKIWVVAGMATSVEMNDVWYSEDGFVWHELKSTTGNWPAGTRHAASTTVYDNALWYMCGINTNTAWKVYNTLTAGISEKSLAQLNVSLYPNPTTGLVKISAPKGEKWNLEIRNVQGQLVTSIATAENNSELDLNLLTEGIYFVNFVNNLGEIEAVEKLVVE